MNEQDSQFCGKARLKVIGVGGGGGNAVNRMLDDVIQGVEYVVINTDSQVLRLSNADTRIQIGESSTRGLGAGADPEVGKKAALEDIDKINAVVRDSDLVFITAGMGGGTGTGAAPIVAKCAQEANALVVAVVTTPFSFEGNRRKQQALLGIEELIPYVDSYIVIPNDKVLSYVGTNTSYIEAFKEVDNVLRRAVQGISEIINRAGIINVDFADVRTVLSKKGKAIMGIGLGEGPNRAIEAARQAIQSPLLEIDINGASDAIVQITGDKDITMKEVEDVLNEIRDATSPDIDIIHGTGLNSELDGEVLVTVIATGFDQKKLEKQVETTQNFNNKPIQPQPVKPVVSGGSTEEKEENKETKVPSWLQSRFRK